MTYDPNYLAPSEYPTSPTTQALADFLPKWMRARTDPADPFQQFVNAPALPLDELVQNIRVSRQNGYLNWPGHYNVSSYKMYRVALSVSIQVDDTLYADGVPYYIAGTTIINPDRTPKYKIHKSTRLHDLYYGYTDVYTDQGTDQTEFTLPYLVDTVHTVTVGGTPTDGYTVATTATLPQATIVVLTEPTSEQVTVKYTTSDVAYVEFDTQQYVYFAKSYGEVWVNTGATRYVPVPYMLFNELDSLGLFYDLPRLSSEDNVHYKQRIQNASVYREASNHVGMLNSVANRLSLIHVDTWADTTTLQLVNVYDHSLRLDLRPLDYYKWSLPANITGDYVYSTDNSIEWVATVPAGVTNQQVSFDLTYGGTDPVHIADLVPTLTMTQAASAFMYEDELTIDTLSRYLFSTKYQFAKGSLALYHNGVLRTAGTDYQEIGQHGFELMFALGRDDTLTANYVLLEPSVPEDLLPSLQQLSLTEDLAILIMTLNPSLVTEVDHDPTQVQTGEVVRYTVTVANYGNVDLDSVNFTITLPPVITMSGDTLTRVTDYTEPMEVRYYTTDDVSLTPLWSRQAIDTLLDTYYGPTAEFTGYAKYLNSIAPIVWGDTVWDLGSWFSVRQWSNADWTVSFSFIPNTYDPDISSYEDSAVYAPGYRDSLFGPESWFGTGLVFGGTRYTAVYAQRKRAFQSGIRYGDDLFATLNLTALDRYVYDDHVIADYVGKHKVILEPGYYYFNNEPHYLFADSCTIAITGTDTVFLPKTESSVYYDSETRPLIKPNSTVWVTYKDAANNFLEQPKLIKQVWFIDVDTLTPSITATEVLTGDGTDRLILNYTNLHDLSLTPAVPYTLQDNIVTTTTPTTAGAEYTATYTVSGSFCVDWNYSTDEAMMKLDGIWPNVYIEYERLGGATTYNTGAFVNPMYSPQSKGFLYLADGYYQVGTIKVWAVPTTVFTGSHQPVMVVAELFDTYGAPVADTPVKFTNSYGDSDAINTNRFGRSEWFFTPHPVAGLVEVIASVTVYNENFNKLTDETAKCYVDVFFTEGLNGPWYAPDTEIDLDDIVSGKYEYYSEDS